MYQADVEYLDRVGRDTFYGHLAQARARLFRDEDFATLYCPDNGRPSVPPSLLAVALLLKAHDKVSDEESVERANFDVRWCVALGLELASEPFVKSTLQEFRAKLVIHEQAGAIFLASIEEAKREGFLRGKKRTIALDTTPIFGKGAVQDTYNLLACGIVMLVRALADVTRWEPGVWARRNDLERYFGTSLKGEAAINWDKKKERKALLARIVGDAQRLLEIAREVRAPLASGCTDDDKIAQAAELLCQLLVQDIGTDASGEPELKQGVAQDRMPSATDPEVRHGRKSKSTRFDGHKATVAVDVDTGLVTAVDVIAGNAPDNENALALVEASEHNTDCEVETSIGDCAFGDGATRQAFAAAERELVAKVPARAGGQLSKDEFLIDLECGCVTCPAGHTTSVAKSKRCETGIERRFMFAAETCAACPLRPQCVKSKSRGRTITVHPQEALLQQARAYQATAAGRETLLKRQVVEHRLARLVQLGVRQSRFFGRSKTKFQLLMAATVANLSLTWSAPLRAAREQARNATEGVVARGVAALSALLSVSYCPSAELSPPVRRADLTVVAT
jgi:transposase